MRGFSATAANVLAKVIIQLRFQSERVDVTFQIGNKAFKRRREN